MSTKTWISTLAAVFVFLTVIFAATRDFLPDFSFQGSSLTGWHSLGPASWRAQNGEIIATPQSFCCERKRRPTAAGKESTSRSPAKAAHSTLR